MKTEDLILVSVDDHVVEPATMFEQHLAPQYKAEAPHIVRKKDGAFLFSPFRQNRSRNHCQ